MRNNVDGPLMLLYPTGAFRSHARCQSHSKPRPILGSAHDGTAPSVYFWIPLFSLPTVNMTLDMLRLIYRKLNTTLTNNPESLRLSHKHPCSTHSSTNAHRCHQDLLHVNENVSLGATVKIIIANMPTLPCRRCNSLNHVAS